jgi:fructose-bisphosphate aldolase class I
MTSTVSSKAMMRDEQFQKVKSGSGFVAALDQSGGSTPKALELYGINEDAYADDDEMFALMHQYRSRIITSPSFGGNRIIAAILFEDTVDRQIDGRASADYLWNVKDVVPVMKIDKGLASAANGVQMMKPIPDLGVQLAKARRNGIFGTKMRSFIKFANHDGVRAIVDQQFALARQILAAELVPIIEPEIDIHSPEKGAAEAMLKATIVESLSSLGTDQRVMLKLSLPDVDDFYAELVSHPRALRVLALSGGYSREEANVRLARNHGVIASFSRALTEGLSVEQTDAEFDAVLDQSIGSILKASET